MSDHPSLPAMTIQEMTKHLRKRIAVAGIKARVRIAPAGGSIQVICPAYDKPFPETDQRQIRFIAKVNHLTLIRGVEIDVERMTDPMQIDFYMPNAVVAS